jgi:hypothetical protein
VPGLRVVYDGKDGRVYENRSVLPRAWIAGSQRVVPGDAAQLAAVGSPGQDTRSTVVTGKPLAGVPRGSQGGAGVARLRRYEPERVLIDADARRPGVLVLSDLDYPGWKAKVDGRDAKVERVDYVLRGVPLAAGRHRVELRYEPLSWRIGWIVSLLTLLALAALVALRARGRRT